MKNSGPKLPKGSACSRWEGIKIHPPLEKDVNHCVVCNVLTATWWIQMPGQSIRLCNDCRETLYNKIGRSFFKSGRDDYVRHCLQVDCVDEELECQECSVWIDAGRPELDDV